MAAKELASVDGRISATTEATIPLPDDGVYRGDGVFEVIRLYRGHPFALREHLDRLERSAAAIELPVERSLIERELEALLAELGTEDAQLRLVLTRAGRRILLTESLPQRGASVRLATVTYSPSVILDRRQVAFLRGQHGGDPDRPGPRRRRGRAGAARRHRARGADLDDLLGLAGGGASNALDRLRHPRVDHPSADRALAPRRGGRVPGRGPARRPRGLPGLDRPRGAAGGGDRRSSARDAGAAYAARPSRPSGEPSRKRSERRRRPRRQEWTSTSATSSA